MTAPRRTRQANGRASIYLGGDGRWHGRVSVGVRNDGSPDRRHVSAKTKSDVWPPRSSSSRSAMPSHLSHPPVSAGPSRRGSCTGSRRSSAPASAPTPWPATASPSTTTSSPASASTGSPPCAPSTSSGSTQTSWRRPPSQGHPSDPRPRTRCTGPCGRRSTRQCAAATSPRTLPSWPRRPVWSRTRSSPSPSRRSRRIFKAASRVRNGARWGGRPGSWPASGRGARAPVARHRLRHPDHGHPSEPAAPQVPPWL